MQNTPGQASPSSQVLVFFFFPHPASGTQQPPSNESPDQPRKVPAPAEAGVLRDAAGLPGQSTGTPGRTAGGGQGTELPLLPVLASPSAGPPASALWLQRPRPSHKAAASGRPPPSGLSGEPPGFSHAQNYGRGAAAEPGFLPSLLTHWAAKPAARARSAAERNMAAPHRSPFPGRARPESPASPARTTCALPRQAAAPRSACPSPRRPGGAADGSARGRAGAAGTPGTETCARVRGPGLTRGPCRAQAAATWRGGAPRRPAVLLRRGLVGPGVKG